MGYYNIKAYYRNPNNKRNFLKAKAYNRLFLDQWIIEQLGYRHRHQKGLSDLPLECLIIHVEMERDGREPPRKAHIGIGSEVIKTTRRLIVICEEVDLLYFWGFDQRSLRHYELEDIWIYGSVKDIGVVSVGAKNLRVPYEHVKWLHCNYNTGRIIDLERALNEREVSIDMDNAAFAQDFPNDRPLGNE